MMQKRVRQVTDLPRIRSGEATRVLIPAFLKSSPFSIYAKLFPFYDERHEINRSAHADNDLRFGCDCRTSPDQ